MCASAAAKELPSSLDFLLRESRNWFAHSPLRLSLYDSLYAAINDGAACKKLIQMSKTRWLVFSAVVKGTLDQWIELKTHFSIMSQNKDDKCHMARVLSEMYNDNSNLLYLTFLKPILEEVARVNTLFQSESANVLEIFKETHTLLMTLARRILKPAYLKVSNERFLEPVDFQCLKTALREDKAYLGINDVDYGVDFEKVGNEKTFELLCLHFGNKKLKIK